MGIISYVYIRVMLPGILKTSRLENMKEERHFERELLEEEYSETELKSGRPKKDPLKSNLNAKSASPEYGLDFKQEYSLSEDSEPRRERNWTLWENPNNQSLGPDRDRKITLDRI